MTPSTTESNALTALRSFLLAVLPVGVDVVKGQDNRVPEPLVGDFVVMTPMRRRRIETNVDRTADVRFTGSIAGSVLTVSAIQLGAIVLGTTLFGVGLATPTTITAQLTGLPGQTGTYTVTPAQTVASATMSSGQATLTQQTELAVQLDVHGPSSGDNAQVITTTMRDAFGINQFANQSPNYGVTPLYAEDPRQMPFINDQQQYEYRWTIDAMLQVGPVVSVPQQYADAVSVTIKSVTATFPP